MNPTPNVMTPEQRALAAINGIFQGMAHGAISTLLLGAPLSVFTSTTDKCVEGIAELIKDANPDFNASPEEWNAAKTAFLNGLSQLLTVLTK